MLPPPEGAPVVLNRFDVAVMMRNVRDQWRLVGYFPGESTPELRQDTWIIVATKDGMRHYSWQEWVPKLESLSHGVSPFFEATISWKDVDTQIRRQKSLEEARANDRLRQVFLESYGEKVLAEWKSQEFIRISKEVFRRFFFRGTEDFEVDNAPAKLYRIREASGVRKKKESYVVSWQPESGGFLKGNQVTDSNCAQISLLSGRRYLVRVASNDGPGSFPIEVDTRPELVKKLQNLLFPWDFLLACCCFLVLIACFILGKIMLKGKTKKDKTVQCERT